jgi:hypothetical protein
MIMRKQSNTKIWGYLGRFSLVHTVTYIVAGIIFYYLQDYKSAFEHTQAFSNFRPLDSAIVRAAPLIQFLRGGLFALILYPFYDVIVKESGGWLKLFWVLWGLTLIGSVAATAGSIEGILYTKTSLKDHLIGFPEVTIQMLTFSWLFVKWERNVDRKRKTGV